MSEKYKVTNITVKPVRKDASGKDTRKAIERIGHPIQTRDERDRLVLIMPGRFKIVNELTQGLITLESWGDAKIEPISDITQALKDHRFQKEQINEERARVAAASLKTESQAKAIEMGKDSHEQRSGSEVEGAVNPDGDPNFLVKTNKVKEAHDLAKQTRD